MLSTAQLLEQIGRLVEELRTIREQTFQDDQVDLGWERLERLKRRATELLAEEVSEDEAWAFQGNDDLFTDLGDEVDRCRNALVALAEELRSHPEVRARYRTGAPSATGEGTKAGGNASWDVFICHASEDKEPFVRKLAEALRAEGLRVWYDEFTLKVGDSLRRSIDRGLASSRFGVVVLSPRFFAKDWPQRELDGLAALEVDGRKVILPVWHDIDADGVRRRSPTLADRIAAKSSDGLGVVVQRLLQPIR
jgi:hypothetical protein